MKPGRAVVTLSLAALAAAVVGCGESAPPTALRPTTETPIACITGTGELRCTSTKALAWCRAHRTPFSSGQAERCAEIVSRLGRPAPQPMAPVRTRPSKPSDPRDLTSRVAQHAEDGLATGWRLRVETSRDSTGKRLDYGYVYALNLRGPQGTATPQAEFDKQCRAATAAAVTVLERRGQLAEIHCRPDRLGGLPESQMSATRISFDAASRLDQSRVVLMRRARRRGRAPMDSSDFSRRADLGIHGADAGRIRVPNG